MGLGMLVILAAGAAFGGWAALAVMGAERARRVRQIESQRPAIPAPTASPTVSSSSPSKGATPRRREATSNPAAKNTR